MWGTTYGPIDGPIGMKKMLSAEFHPRDSDRASWIEITTQLPAVTGGSKQSEVKAVPHVYIGK